MRPGFFAETRAEEDAARQRFYLALAALTAWSHYPGYADPSVPPPELEDPRKHAADVRALLDELRRHADRTARILEAEGDVLQAKIAAKQYAAENYRLRAELFKLNKSPQDVLPGETA